MLKPHDEIVRGVMTTVERSERCECRRARDLLRGIPRDYRAAELTGFPKPVEEAARTWLQQLRSDSLVNLLASGPTGTGKTWLAVALLKEARRGGLDVTFREASQIYLEIRQAQALDEPPDGVRKVYTQAPVLVIDDIGSGSDSDFERRVLLDIVSNRLSRGRCTVATTNLTMDEIAEQIDDRLSSRLAQYTQIELRGRDRRLT